MMVPGSNLLAMALTVIGKQQFAYYQNTGRSTNAAGLLNATYLPSVNLSGSVQAVPRELFEKYGLDFQKNYIIFYVEKSVIDVQRDLSGDKIVYGGKTFQCLSKTDWFAQDGWVGVIAVQVQSA